MAPTAPQKVCVINGNTGDRHSTSRAEVQWQAVAHASDSGLILYDHNSYWVNMSLGSVRKLVGWLNEWITYQSSRFKPTGFVLTNPLTNEKREITNGARIVLVGDSFYVQNETGEALSEALSAMDWVLTPIYPATAKAE